MKRGVLAAFLILAAPDRLSISVVPHTLFAGNALRLTCHVPRQPENRLLAYGILGYLHAEREMDGEHAPVTWRSLIDHVPCDVGPAYCMVTRSDGTQERVTSTILVTGC